MPPPAPAATSPRTRADRCPGVLRPWPADDGALVRLRLVGGRVSPGGLAAASAVAQRYGDGDVHLTGRANLQLRALPTAPDGSDGPVLLEVVAALEAGGLLPSRTHELVRNVLVSPATGLAGGRTDLRPLAAELDRRLCADPALAALPGRFLLVLDDGRGDLADRPCDLGLVALDATTAQLRVGAGWGPVVHLAGAPAALLGLAHAFLAARGTGPEAAWHVTELEHPLDHPLAQPAAADPRAAVRTDPLPYGEGPAGLHVPAPGGVLDGAAVADLVELAGERELVVTPWRGVLVPAAGGSR
ncbi:nitrite reductase [Nocardioides sp. SYSU DS0663]|uniref:nitrite reductase n=1 Tax=Nocardioides sp. SYSU DS0663 TaxID=3416445 RepID=UPI003F4BDCFB